MGGPVPVTAAELAERMPGAVHVPAGGVGVPERWTAGCPRAAEHRPGAPSTLTIWGDTPPRVVCMGGCSDAQVLGALGIPSDSVGMREAAPGTDLFLAQRLAALHGADLRFTQAAGWRVWDGTRWRLDDGGAVARLAKDSALTLLREASECQDDDRRKALARAAMRAQSAGGLRAMIELAATEPGVAAREDALDADPLLLNLNNGTLDLRDGSFREHRREDMVTKCSPVAYDPAATCPRWQAFLSDILPDAEVRAFLQRWAGYTLSGLTVEQKMLLLHGTGANGKSTFVAVLLHALGDYGLSMDFDVLAARRDAGGPRADLARLQGSRVAVAVEAAAGRAVDEPVLKTLTGSDRIAARRLYREAVQFVPTFKLLLACNHKPRVSSDAATWRRLLLAPFSVSIPPERQDPHLADALKAEASGVLNWMLDGWRAYWADGLRVPASMESAVAGYREAEDAIGGFVSDCCELDRDAVTLGRDLLASYSAWAATTGEEAVSAKALHRLLADRGLRSDRRGPRKTTRWHGVRLIGGGCVSNGETPYGEASAPEVPEDEPQLPLSTDCPDF